MKKTILFNKFLPIDVIRKVWEHVGGGNMMRIEKINSLIGISNYVSDYIVKGVSDHSKQVSQLKFFKKRYAISKSCIRPKKITQKADPKDDRFKEVYNTLNNDDYEEKEISL